MATGSTQTVPGGTATGSGTTLTPQIVDEGTSDFVSLFQFTVDAEGCTVRVAGVQQQYLLAATSPNYGALFSTLLACWLDGRRVSITYASPLLQTHTATGAEAPLRIVSISAMTS